MTTIATVPASTSAFAIHGFMVEPSLYSTRARHKPLAAAATIRNSSRMRRALLAVACVVILAALVPLSGRGQPDAPVVRGAHRFQRVADGIYYATSAGTMNTGANTPVILTDADALIVDSSITPAAGRA